MHRTSSTFFKTSELLTFSVQLIFSIFLHNHILNAAVLLIAASDIVHVSDAHKTILQTKHLAIRFFKSENKAGHIKTKSVAESKVVEGKQQNGK